VLKLPVVLEKSPWYPKAVFGMPSRTRIECGAAQTLVVLGDMWGDLEQGRSRLAQDAGAAGGWPIFWLWQAQAIESSSIEPAEEEPHRGEAY